VGTVRELLNRLRWDARAGRAGVVLAVRSREGGVERLEEVDFDAVVDILPGGVTLADGAFLPYHRLVTVRRGGEVLWPGGRR
jgi:uncharacterized protein (UPF0248 family)